MKRYSEGLIVMIVGALLLIGCIKSKDSEDNPIEGVWSVRSIKWILPDTTYHLPLPEPGVLFFSGNSYAFIWTPSAEPRVPFVNLANPSEKEIIAGFRSIVFNTGTFTKDDTQVTVTAEIAKVPGFEGGTQVFNYQINQDTLTYTMVDETYPTGDKPTWYSKMKTEFVLVKK